MQVGLIRNLVRTASSNINTDTQIGRTPFTLLVPVDLEPFLGGSTETVLELDEGARGHSLGDVRVVRVERQSNQHQKPWSIRTKLLRKLRAPPRRRRPSQTLQPTTAFS